MNDKSKTSLPFGSWPSNITAERVAGKTPKLAEPCIDNNRLFWLQTLPEEKGRVAVMMKPLVNSHSAPKLVAYFLDRLALNPKYTNTAAVVTV